MKPGVERRREPCATEVPGVERGDGNGGDRRREWRQGDCAVRTLEFFGIKVKRHETGYYL
jgi:hypothetical protein